MPLIDCLDLASSSANVYYHKRSCTVNPIITINRPANLDFQIMAMKFPHIDLDQITQMFVMNLFDLATPTFTFTSQTVILNYFHIFYPADHRSQM